MPLPLSIAFLGMGVARRMHLTSASERPALLRRVYYARLAAYFAFGTGSLVSFSDLSKGHERKLI
jgi:hypothetical protein